MRRIVALLLLVLAACFLTEGLLDDPCHGSDRQAAVVCHLGCADSCGAVPLAPGVVVPPADRLPEVIWVAPVPASPILGFPEPETGPPRASRA